MTKFFIFGLMIFVSLTNFLSSSMANPIGWSREVEPYKASNLSTKDDDQEALESEMEKKVGRLIIELLELLKRRKALGKDGLDQKIPIQIRSTGKRPHKSNQQDKWEFMHFG